MLSLLLICAMPEEIQVSKATRTPIATMAQRVWVGLRPQDRKRSDVLFEDTTKRVVYEQLRMPIIRDRDYTMLTERIDDPASGAVTIAFELHNELGPKENARHVRMQLLRGRWIFAPLPDGSVLVTHVCQSDPAGGVPPFMALPHQKALAVALMEEVTR